MRFAKFSIALAAMIFLTAAGPECNRSNFESPTMEPLKSDDFEKPIHTNAKQPNVISPEKPAHREAGNQDAVSVARAETGEQEKKKDTKDEKSEFPGTPEFSMQTSPDLVRIRFPENMVVQKSSKKTLIDKLRRLRSGKTMETSGSENILWTEPQIKSVFYWEDEKTLVLKPRDRKLPVFEGFTVELVQVDTQKGIMRSPKPGAWSAHFKLARLELMEAKVKSVDYEDRMVKVHLKWNGDVDLSDLQEKITIHYNNMPVDDFELSLGDSGVVVLTASISEPKEDNKLRLDIEKNVHGTTRGIGSLGRYVRSFELRDPKSLAIRDVDIKEGAQGYYLRVRCRDHERGSYYRCDVKEDELENKVSFTPEVETTFVHSRRGFKVFGDFKARTYTLKIDKGLRSEHGALLKQEFEKELDIPTRTSKVSFMTKGRYLPGHYLTRVPVRHLNVDHIDIEVRKVPEKNLVFWMSGSKEKLDDRTSDYIGSRKYVVPDQEDKKLTSWLDLSALVPPDKKGVFQFTVKGGKSSDSLRVVLTEIALVAKRFGEDQRNLYVWAMDAKSLEPIPDVRVKLVTTSNRAMAQTVTDGKGLAVFRNIQDPLKPADKPPFAIVAGKGTDLTFLRFKDLQVPLSEFPVHGKPYSSDNPYRAAVYTDRGVYRPGETAHVAAVIWEDNNRAPQKEVPVIGRLKDPRGKEVDSITTFTNQAGMVSFDYPLQDFAPTGKYEFYLDIGGNNVKVHPFHVEEFVPERMEVKVKPRHPQQLYTDPAVFNVKAKYLFGADAKGARAEARCILEEADMSFDKYPGYTFNVWRAEKMKPVPLEVLETKLDNSGAAQIVCPPAGDVVSARGPAKIKAKVSVFESGSGRTTVETGSMRVHPDDYYIGLKSSAESVNNGQKIDFKGVVIDWEGNMVEEIPGLTVELIELQSEWVWEYDSDLGRSHYHRYRREVPRSSKKVRVKDGRFKYSFTHSGYVEGYLVRAYKADKARTEAYLRGNGYDWYWSRYRGRKEDRDTTPGPDVPEGLAIKAPHNIQVNRPATVSMNLPYPGKLLFTVETDEIVKHQWINVDEGKFTTDFTLGKFAPNVYVSVLLVKDPYYESKEAFIPGRSYGVQSIKVEPVKHKTKVEIFTPDKVQPNNELKVEIQTAPGEGPVYATVAAVDEGILQLTDFESPDPLAELFKKRSLGVRTFETIGWTLLLPPSAKASITGGGGPGTHDARNGQSRVHTIEPVALWSGLLEVDPQGRAEVTFQVPTYRGRLRAMTVVAGPSRVGSATTNVLVKDPLVLQPSFPRFLSAKDEFVAPVFITNTTNQQRNITVSLEHSAEIEISDSTEKSIVLGPDQSGLVTYLCKVNAAYGAASFDVKASAGDIVSTDHVDLPIKISGGEINELTVKEIEPGENDFTSLLDGWMPQYEQTTVTLTSNRYINELSHLKYLVRYPYGCIEQTTSTTRPLLFISSILPAIDPEIVKNAPIEDMVMHGLNRILSMQNSDGGFAYWPGGNDSCFWGSVYATHVLLEAKDAGYPVDEKKLANAVGFLEKTLTYSPGRSDRRHDYKKFVDTEPYMHFIVAKAGKGRAKRVRNLIEDPPDEWGHLEQENMFFLKAALYMMGDHTYEHELRHPSLEINDKRVNDWSFWSALRTKGIMLNLTEDMMPKNPGTAPLAQTVAKQLNRKSLRYTTQDLAWCISGLGRRSAYGADKWTNPRLLLDGKDIPPTQKSKKAKKAQAWSIKGASSADALTLSVDSIKGGELYALVRVEGIKPGASVQTGDHSIRVERAYRDASGKPVRRDKVEVGDLVFVELTLLNLTGQAIENVALVDRFAAGFEIENPRLGREHVSKWFDPKKRWKTDYMNMRDSSIEFFGKLGHRSEVKVTYAMRAVTGGRFYTPPVRAEAMYDPYVWSQKAGKKVTITDPWGVITN